MVYTHSPKGQSKEDSIAEAEVISKAIRRAAENLVISQKELSSIIGISEASISRLYNGHKIHSLSSHTKEGELALMLLRAYRSLDSFFSGNLDLCREWFKSYNHHLNGVPEELVTKIDGLVAVVVYLDAMRGNG